jgi:biopolymer transport protein ExbB
VPGLSEFWGDRDGVGRAVMLVLLAMSVAAWVLIVWKGWLLRRAGGDIARAVPAFWDAESIDAGRARLAELDREQLLVPLLDAAAAQPQAGTLETAGRMSTQLTRRLRDALHRGLANLQFGQVVLASIGSTAPFVGLFGTVWGIYHALAEIAAAGSVGIDKVAGPIGESLIMTAGGIAVAVPAVLAYNVFGKKVAACEAELEGFAHDLREMVLDTSGASAPASAAGGAGAAASGPARGRRQTPDSGSPPSGGAGTGPGCPDPPPLGG